MDAKEKWWTMHFDGAVRREGDGVGVDSIATYCIKQFFFLINFISNVQTMLRNMKLKFWGLKL